MHQKQNKEKPEHNKWTQKQKIITKYRVRYNKKHKNK